ncbi:MAG: Smr/MutS family protein [Flavobacteriales bacterium]|nr:Smr/MutS family protein [Flavobacteriales bacterium]
MPDYTFQIGEQVSFLNESGTGRVVSIREDGMVMVLTEDDFEMPYPVSVLVPRFDLKSEVEKEVPNQDDGPIQEYGGFKLGMKAQVIDKEDRGVIRAFTSEGMAELEFEDLFVEIHPVKDLIAIDEVQLKKLSESIEEVSMQDIGEDVKVNNPQRALKDRKDQGVWEIDLHIQELVDNSFDMMKHEIVQLQLDHFDKKLNEAIDKGLRKVIFIHGRGEGRLKNAIREILKRYPFCEYLDADYKRYGVGATEVRIKYRPQAE